MVIYDLQCQAGHRFEGWFPNADSFSEQLAANLVCCSLCGIYSVTKIPSGPNIGRCRVGAVPELHHAEAKDPVIHDQDLHEPREKMVNVDPVLFTKALHQYIAQHFQNVGREFASKAIRMKKGEVQSAAIYGTATEEEQILLEDEGIDYTLVPKLPEEIEN